jgi:hypothetical protein
MVEALDIGKSAERDTTLRTRMTGDTNSGHAAIRVLWS